MKVCLVLNQIEQISKKSIFFVIFFIGEKAAIGDKTLNLKLILCLLCLFICSQFLINEPYTFTIFRSFQHLASCMLVERLPKIEIWSEILVFLMRAFKISCVLVSSTLSNETGVSSVNT